MNDELKQKKFTTKEKIKHYFDFILFLLFMFLLCFMLSLCSCGKYCINANVEKYGIEGQICYDSAQSELEGNVVFLDSSGKKIIGFDEKDITDIISIIESGKKLWDYGKDFFGISTQEFASERLQRILTEYRKGQKYGN